MYYIIFEVFELVCIYAQEVEDEDSDIAKYIKTDGTIENLFQSLLQSWTEKDVTQKFLEFARVSTILDAMHVIYEGICLRT